LGTTATTPTLSINIPTFFTDTVNFKKDITAPNIIYGITKGDGINTQNISGITKITNTGVLSVNGSTGAVAITAGDGISITGNKITNSYSFTPDYSQGGWEYTGTTLGLATTTDSVIVDSLTFGNATITNGKSILPNTDLGSDLGSSAYRFNNLWVANINSNSSQSFSGQTTFSFAPTDTTISKASILINPTTSVADG